MPSRLSSLLVRDGLVGVKRMEKAFQRQVIYGGSLDTILLEMSFVVEERLSQYLALASGLPPAARDEGDRADPAASQMMSREISEQFRAVPLAAERDALRVLVCSPLEMTELEDLADLLDRPLQPLITPEYRWHLAYAKAYGVDVPARYSTLARQLATDDAPAPVGRSRSVIIEDVKDGRSEPRAIPRPPPPTPTDARPEQLESVKTLPLVPAVPKRPAAPAPPPPVTDAPTMPLDFDTPTVREKRLRSDTLVDDLPPVAPDPRAARGTMMGVTPNQAGTVTPTRGGLQSPPGGIPVAAVDGVSITQIVMPSGDPERNPQAAVAIRKAEDSPATGETPLAYIRARELLATAEDRDAVFMTLLRAARARARYAALLTVQGGAVIGRAALAEPGIDVAAVSKVLIPLDAASPFRMVVQSAQPHVGSVTSGDPTIDAMLMRFGGTVPPSALIMPLVLRERVVALVVAHRMQNDLKLVDITELLPLAAAAADALGRLIVKHKSAGYRAPDATPEVQIEAEHVETKKNVRDGGEWRAPAERPTVPSLDAEPVLAVAAKPIRHIDQVLDDIERAKEGSAEESIADAIERAQDTLGALAKRFPGKLRVDRFAVSGRPLRPAQYGGLLELAVRLGGAASELLIEQMGSAQRDHRFYATICAAELRPRNAVYALVERLFDSDFGVRAAAVEALAGYPLQDLANALVRARRAVHSSDVETVAAATTAIVRLGDVDAVGDLIGAVERGDRGAEHVRRCLIALTAQDFGVSERKWRKWYEGARRRHRIEWLIDGLVHKEDAIRETAIGDLRRLTGEYFGYHHDLAKKEREVAAERWAAWWRDTGQRRFVARDDERHRPTAILPLKTPPR